MILNETPKVSIETEPAPLQPMTIKVDVSHLPDKYRQRLEEIHSALLRLPENLKFPTGIVLIVGANGSGKTTLLKAMSIALFPEGKDGDGDLTRLREMLAHNFSQSLVVPDDRIAIVLESGALINSKMVFDRSQRQGIDALLKKQLASIDAELGISSGTSNGDIVILVDEPELGMDPKRHEMIEKEMSVFLDFAPLVIIATNSPYLYNSNLPRIDLSQPEKGIFWPQEELNKRLALGFSEGHFE